MVYFVGNCILQQTCFQPRTYEKHLSIMKNTSDKPRILLATSLEAEVPLTKALADAYILLPCHTQAEGASILSESGGDIDLILCTLRFDDRRMYDFLQHVKTNDQTRSIPFVCLTVTRSALGNEDIQTINAALEKMVKGFGGSGFIDYFGWCKEYGMAQGNENLLAYIAKLLSNNEKSGPV